MEGIFSEATFYPAFARDLEEAKEFVVMFSPFLTSRGVGRWANHFQAALQRSVQIRVVTRPSVELGGASEGEISETIERLRELGVVVDLRGRMHEKLAIIDGRVAWQGSLNILSHRDTSECMLRLTGTTVCERLMDLISPSIKRRDDAGRRAGSENPSCPECGIHTVLYDGRYGIYFECPNAQCGAKIDPRRQTFKRTKNHPPPQLKKKVRSLSDSGRPCPRPDCNGRLVKRNGRNGPFLGCSNYPRCRETQDL